MGQMCAYGVALGKLARFAESRVYREVSQSEVAKHVTIDPSSNRQIQRLHASHFVRDR